jgi:lipopolysaccharide transport protein LptA
MRLLRNFIFFCCCLAPLCARSLPDDNLQNMHIIADSTLFNYKTGANTYNGNVKVDQGGTHLLADRVTTHSSLHHKIEEAVAYGIKKPADYWTIPKKGDPLFHAQARFIRFYPAKSQVFLEGDVVITQGNNSFHGPLIIYNIKDQTISAPASNKGRATIIIEPTKIQPT